MNVTLHLALCPPTRHSKYTLAIVLSGMEKTCMYGLPSSFTRGKSALQPGRRTGGRGGSGGCLATAGARAAVVVGPRAKAVDAYGQRNVKPLTYRGSWTHPEHGLSAAAAAGVAASTSRISPSGTGKKIIGRVARSRSKNHCPLVRACATLRCQDPAQQRPLAYHAQFEDPRGAPHRGARVQCG